MSSMQRSVACSLLVIASLAILAGAQQTREPTKVREQAVKLQQQGNWKDALELFRGLLEDASNSGAVASKDLQRAVECLQHLGSLDQLDGLLKRVVQVHSQDWRVLTTAAQALMEAPHEGMVVDQVWVRAPQTVHMRGRWLSATEQDRQQALQWLVQALECNGELPRSAAPDRAPPAGSASERGEVWLQTVRTLLFLREGRLGWRLQGLAALQSPPDYLDADVSSSIADRYAAVDEAGQPILWPVPADWASAQSDAERVRWALQRLDALSDKTKSANAQFAWANFLHSQFSVDTLQEHAWFLRGHILPRPQSATDGADEPTGILAVHTLSDQETIAKLSSGIRRFSLPDDLNPLLIYQRLATGRGEIAELAQAQVVATYLNRRQYDRAAEQLRSSIERFGDKGRFKRQELDSITKPRGAFDPVPAQPAGQAAHVSLVFRNARSAAFKAQRVDLEALLADLKAFYRNSANANRPNFGGRSGHWPPAVDSPQELFSEQLGRYVGKTETQWSMDLDPREHHWDRRLDVKTPLTQAGLYVVTCSLDGGAHQLRCLVWLQDLAIVRKPLADGHWILVADAISGQGVSGCNVEFFGVQQLRDPNARFVIDNFARKTDAQGMLTVSDSATTAKQWWIVARDDHGRTAITGSQNFWLPTLDHPQVDRWKAYGVADQPVHHPGDMLRAKFWIGHASYAPDVPNRPIANTSFTVKVLDPQGKLVSEHKLSTDEFGGLELNTQLPASCGLGVYAYQVFHGEEPVSSNLRVRVEEFRKPEYEVKVTAPDRPVKLGEKIEAVITAKYYFGSPVTDAQVKVRVTRTAYQDHWYPIRPFDWCYGAGYWWAAYNYQWYPGWSRWVGCMPPRVDWHPRWRQEPSELVLDQELQLDRNGTARVVIDTALAAEVHADQDHQYQIQVEVRDASRRTQTASGAVIASRQPFKIYSWLGHGYYDVNQTVDAHFVAQTLDGRPVAATGQLDLLRISYDADRRPQETVVESWPAKTDESGHFDQRFTARRGGQYRLRLTLSDQSGDDVEGAYMFTVRGDQQAADNFRFSELELIPDRSEYAPGDKVQLQINADRADAMVYVFVRPTHGVVAAPQVIRLASKTARVEIPVSAADQPNFFVEAFTITNGKFYSAVREIFVPPASRMLDVQVQPDKPAYLPGESAQVAVQVRDAAGQPVAGNVLVAIYDRALEQIAADVLPEDIREYFWKWRRQHQPVNSESLTRVLQPVHLAKVPAWTPLGIFGSSLADDAEQGSVGLATKGMSRGDGQMAGGMMMRAMGVEMDMAMGLPAMARAAPEADAPGDARPGQTQPQVRKDFADSALWVTRLQCDSQGRAQVKYRLPENLTDWQMRSWAVASELRVGSATASAVTRKQLMVRLATPRFLVQQDEAVLSAIVHNDFAVESSVQVRLEIDGQTQLELLDPTTARRSVTVGAGQQVRVDWRCRALAAGTIKLRVYAETPQESDAMEVKLPIVVRGLLKTDSWAGTVRADQASQTVKLHVPAQRRSEASRLVVRTSPSLALAMVDALPYLAEYPYDCTEQTLNRFLPTIMTQRMLQHMQVDLQQIKDQRSRLNAQELGDAATRAGQWQRFEHNPVFDNAEVDRMVDAGIRKLTDMQNADGGWGWLSGPYANSTPHSTATVVRGLLIAQQNGAAIVPDVLQRGIAWLEQYQNAELQKLQNAGSKKSPQKAKPDNIDALVFHVLVLADHKQDSMLQRLMTDRDGLSVYGKALLAWATHKLGNREQTQMLRRNIEQFLVVDLENETAYLRDPAPWWVWYGSSIEAAAIYLKLLAAEEPRGETAPRLVKYLLNNRKAASHWNSTRDTALVVEAFADYLRASGEATASVAGEVWLGSRRLGSVSFTPQTLFTAETTLEIAGEAVPTGEHVLEIRRTGQGPLYFSVYLTNFTQEASIPAAGLEVKLARRYYRLVPKPETQEQAGSRGQVLQTRRASYDRIPIAVGDTLASGALIEVELIVESKNDYEYLIIEDRKPAGLEPVDAQSGYLFGDGLGAYRELREQHVALLLSTLPQGKHSLSYRLRTEVPGRFSGLPASITGMYAPELAGNSADQEIRIESEK